MYINTKEGVQFKLMPGNEIYVDDETKKFSTIKDSLDNYLEYLISL